MFKQKTTRLQQGSFFVFVEYIKSDLIYFYIYFYFLAMMDSLARQHLEDAPHGLTPSFS